MMKKEAVTDMIFRNIQYFLVQGFKGVVSNRLMSIVSIGTVIASLVLFGLCTLLGMNVNYFADQIKDQCQFNVYMKKDIDRDGLRSVASQLESIDGVESITLYTKEERFEKAKEDYDEQADAIDILEENNPLRDSYIVTLRDLSESTKVAQLAQQIEGVEEVTNRQDIIDKILKVTDFIHNLSIWLLVILVAISIFIISNTIKLGLFARRKEINIMKFVGATNWFIRWPFIIEGAILGVIGAALAAVIVIFVYSSMLGSFSEFLGSIELLSTSYALKIIIYSFLALGIGIGTIGSVLSIHKHLHV